MADETRLSTCRVRVRVVDTDMMGIAHHAAYLSYFETGRIEYMRARGVVYSEWVGRDVHLPVVEVKIRYRRPARFDDLLLLETSLGKSTPFSLRFDYRITRQDGESTAWLLRGYTLLSCIGNDASMRQVPDEIVQALNGPELLGAGAAR